MTVLLVEDNPLYRSIVKSLLQKDGFQIVEAADGIDGYNAILEFGRSIDLLLTDIQMPRMDGLSLAKLVRERHPGMPVLLMSGQASLLVDRIEDYAMLQKPFRRQTLVQTIRDLIAGVAISPEKKPCPAFTPVLPTAS